jgi:peptidylprolyl isomerase
MVAAAPPLPDSLFRPLGSLRVLTSTYERLEAPEDVEPMVALLYALGEAARPGPQASDADAAAQALLRREAQHPRVVVRQAAAEALAELTGQAPPPPPAQAPPLADEAALDWTTLAALGPHPRLVLDTERGRVTLRLDTEQAPLTTQTIARFAEAGRYDGVPFHRVVPNFVVQGGDFARGDGYGGPAFSIRSEFTRLPYRRGTLGMASAGKDTEGSQFFVTHSMQPHLDGRYTAFGTVVEGLDIIDRLVPGDRIATATVLRTSEATAR